jgi:hypothetical protein
MRRFAMWLVLLALAFGTPAGSWGQPYGARPINLLLDVCVLPADGCATYHDVMTLDVDDQPMKVGIMRTEVLNGSPRTGSVQTELTLKPMKAVGPKELLSQLKPGARLRVRVSTRISDRMMMLMSVEPAKEK